jgi:hypothetical protein
VLRSQSKRTAETRRRMLSQTKSNQMAASNPTAKAPEAHFSAGGTGAGIYFKAPPVFCAPPAQKEDPAIDTSNLAPSTLWQCLHICNSAHTNVRARAHHQNIEMSAVQSRRRSLRCFRTNGHGLQISSWAFEDVSACLQRLRRGALSVLQPGAEGMVPRY